MSPLVTIGHSLREKILSHVQIGDEFYIASVALSEFLFGIGSLPRANQNLKEWEYLKLDFKYLNVTSVEAENAAKLRLLLRQQGWQLGLVDALLAIIALQNDLILLTTDRDFQKIPHLKQENWRI